MSDAPITSLQNPRVLAARKLLRRGQRADAFLVEGLSPVLEALRVAEVQEVFLSETLSDPGAVLESAGSVPVQPVSDAVMKALSDTSTPQGVVAVVRRPRVGISSLPADIGLALVLVAVRDPGNAGTLVRSAVATGADAVIFSEGSVDPFAPKPVRASAGTLFHVPVVSGIPFSEAADALKPRGVRLIGAEATAASAHHDVDLTGPVAFVLGNEAWGIPEDLRSEVDQFVSIPMPGPAESLNVGIAGSLLLFEALRQRGGVRR